MTDTYEGTSAIVVNFESGQLLVSCVRSLEKAGAGEVIVVDNASGDDSIERLREAGTSARIVLAPSNRGFGAGANLGARQASGEVLVVCNPDLVVEEGSLTALVEALVGHADVAAVGPRILTDEGELYPSARPFPTLTESAGHAFVGLFTQSNRWTRAYRQEDRAAGEVDWVSGACAAFRREAFAAVGGFDERYFMYVEDVDLCWRLQRAGWRVLYEPAATVTHVQGASTRRRPYRMLVAHHRSLWRFACKTAVGKQKLALPAVALGLCARLCLAVAKHAATGRVVT